MEHTVVVHKGEVIELQRLEQLDDPFGVEHAVGVEADPRAPYRDGEEEFASRGDDTDQFAGDVPGTSGIELVAVTAQADVLRYVEAGQRLHRAVGKGQLAAV